jgi:type VI protein secretion system component VasK
VQRLMQEPLTGIDGIIGGLSAAGLNAKGASFCTDFRAVVNKYPFAAAAGAQASVDEVMAAFQPGASMLSAFYEGTLAEVLEQRGRQFGARVGADPQPSAQFVAFFNRATAVSNGLFEAGAAEPRVTFLFRPQATAEVPEITVSMDGRAVTFSRTEAGHQSFTWDATRARGIRITGRIDGVETALLEGQGVWGIFQIFQQAAWSGGEGGRQTVQWRVPMLQQPLTAEITFASRIPIFNPAVLRVGCVAQVAR